MTETAADEQDLAKALDSVASSLDGTSSVQPASSTDSSVSSDQPIVLPNSPVAPSVQPITVTPLTPAAEPTYPPIIPAHDSSDHSAGSSDQFTVPTPMEIPTPSPSDTSAQSDDSASTDASDDSTATDDITDMSTYTSTDTTVDDGPLADIKKNALDELRPLVDKLDVDPQEKFDTYLLLIRSTDDTSLIGPAHEAAKTITDESKRAEALLEIVKEIDYLSRKK